MIKNVKDYCFCLLVLTLMFVGIKTQVKPTKSEQKQSNFPTNFENFQIPNQYIRPEELTDQQIEKLEQQLHQSSDISVDLKEISALKQQMNQVKKQYEKLQDKKKFLQSSKDIEIQKKNSLEEIQQYFKSNLKQGSSKYFQYLSRKQKFKKKLLILQKQYKEKQQIIQTLKIVIQKNKQKLFNPITEPEKLIKAIEQDIQQKKYQIQTLKNIFDPQFYQTQLKKIINQQQKKLQQLAQKQKQFIHQLISVQNINQRIAHQRTFLREPKKQLRRQEGRSVALQLQQRQIQQKAILKKKDCIKMLAHLFYLEFKYQKNPTIKQNYKKKCHQHFHMLSFQDALKQLENTDYQDPVQILDQSFEAKSLQQLYSYIHQQGQNKIIDNEALFNYIKQLVIFFDRNKAQGDGQEMINFFKKLIKHNIKFRKTFQHFQIMIAKNQFDTQIALFEAKKHSCESLIKIAFNGKYLIKRLKYVKPDQLLIQLYFELAQIVEQHCHQQIIKISSGFQKKIHQVQQQFLFKNEFTQAQCKQIEQSINFLIQNIQQFQKKEYLIAQEFRKKYQVYCIGQKQLNIITKAQKIAKRIKFNLTQEMQREQYQALYQAVDILQKKRGLSLKHELFFFYLRFLFPQERDIKQPPEKINTAFTLKQAIEFSLHQLKIKENQQLTIIQCNELLQKTYNQLMNSKNYFTLQDYQEYIKLHQMIDVQCKQKHNIQNYLLVPSELQQLVQNKQQRQKILKQKILTSKSKNIITKLKNTKHHAMQQLKTLTSLMNSKQNLTEQQCQNFQKAIHIYVSQRKFQKENIQTQQLIAFLDQQCFKYFTEQEKQQLKYSAQIEQKRQRQNKKIQKFSNISVKEQLLSLMKHCQQILKLDQHLDQDQNFIPQKCQEIKNVQSQFKKQTIIKEQQIQNKTQKCSKLQIKLKEIYQIRCLSIDENKKTTLLQIQKTHYIIKTQSPLKKNIYKKLSSESKTLSYQDCEQICQLYEQFKPSNQFLSSEKQQINSLQLQINAIQAYDAIYTQHCQQKYPGQTSMLNVIKKNIIKQKKLNKMGIQRQKLLEKQKKKLALSEEQCDSLVVILTKENQIDISAFYASKLPQYYEQQCGFSFPLDFSIKNIRRRIQRLFFIYKQVKKIRTQLSRKQCKHLQRLYNQLKKSNYKQEALFQNILKAQITFKCQKVLSDSLKLKFIPVIGDKRVKTKLNPSFKDKDFLCQQKNNSYRKVQLKQLQNIKDSVNCFILMENKKYLRQTQKYRIQAKYVSKFFSFYKKQIKPEEKCTVLKQILEKCNPTEQEQKQELLQFQNQFKTYCYAFSLSFRFHKNLFMNKQVKIQKNYNEDVIILQNKLYKITGNGQYLEELKFLQNIKGQFFLSSLKKQNVIEYPNTKYSTFQQNIYHPGDPYYNK